MNHKKYFRLFLVILVVSISLILFSYSSRKNASAQSQADCGQCEQKKTQTEFILFETLSNLLSINH